MTTPILTQRFTDCIKSQPGIPNQPEPRPTDQIFDAKKIDATIEEIIQNSEKITCTALQIFLNLGNKIISLTKISRSINTEQQNLKVEKENTSKLLNEKYKSKNKSTKRSNQIVLLKRKISKYANEIHNLDALKNKCEETIKLFNVQIELLKKEAQKPIEI